MKRIAELRKERALSQVNLALKLNLTQYMISAYESGRNQPSLEILVQIADFFGVSVDYLLERTDSRILISKECECDMSLDEVLLMNNYGALTPEQKSVAIKLICCMKNYDV